MTTAEYEKRVNEIANAHIEDERIRQAIEDTVGHCSICGLAMTDEIPHDFCVAEMNSKFYLPE